MNLECPFSIWSWLHDTISKNNHSISTPPPGISHFFLRLRLGYKVPSSFLSRSVIPFCLFFPFSSVFLSPSPAFQLCFTGCLSRRKFKTFWRSGRQRSSFPSHSTLLISESFSKTPSLISNCSEFLTKSSQEPTTCQNSMSRTRSSSSPVPAQDLERALLSRCTDAAHKWFC